MLDLISPFKNLLKYFRRFGSEKEIRIPFFKQNIDHSIRMAISFITGILQ